MSYRASNNSRVSRRPATIAELAEKARNNDWDERGNIKYYLRLAENYRKHAKAAVQQNDLESAFVGFARAASLVLEKIPRHAEYQTTLNSTQRQNLSLNGQDILDNLGLIKPVLLKNYDDWMSRHPNGGGTPDTSETDAGLESRMNTMSVKENPREQERLINEELTLWVKQREEREAADRNRVVKYPDSRGDTAMDVARLAADSGTSRSGPHHNNFTFMTRQQDVNGNRAGSSIPSAPAMSMPTPSLSSTSSTYYASPAPVQYPPAQSTLYSPTVVHSQSASFLNQQSGTPAMMPLESPSRYDGDSTDSEAPPHYDWRRYGRHREEVAGTPTRQPLRTNSYPFPTTTTSPPPTLGSRIMYPELMTQHQKAQGYYPSLHSMFNPPSHLQSTGLFDGTDSRSTAHGLYSPNLLPRPSSSQTPSISLQRPPLVHKYKEPPDQPSPPSPGDDVSHSSSMRGASSLPGLKQVNVPRECLPRFLSIAAANTAMNKETCGLLLGKNKSNKYVVTTLLIPKQHSTSDTCTMDEEELVLHFTEERSLITLGWIHTHPSQSCFMSSVDLHTHSGFQRMLPESFAVVCAPKSNPNFGIFRLTDPPGLQVVLNCTEKEAFHPHPDVPIYTDADRGHVQMKDIPLEIVDLR